MRSQLTEANITNIGGNPWAAQYIYHDNGDMYKRTLTGKSQAAFTYIGNLMDTASGGENFDLDWDDNGQLTLNDQTTGDDTSLTWNWDNKLRSAQKGSNSISLRYDPWGNRIKKTSSASGTRKYIVDIAADLPVILLELEGSSIKKTYIYGNSQILAQHDGDASTTPPADIYFYLHDRLGSVRQIIDGSGNVKNVYSYKPFGELFATETTENVSNPFMFTGQFFDSEIDEYYLRARMYDPYIYRFTSRDPVLGEFKEPLTLHKYLYCLNDPLNRIDPSGELFGLLVGHSILSSLRSLDYKMSMAIWGRSLNFVQQINLIQLDRAVAMELLIAEFEGGLTEYSVDAIVSFITPWLGKVSPALKSVAKFGFEVVGDRKDLTELLREPSTKKFWDYFWRKVPGTVETELN